MSMDLVYRGFKILKGDLSNRIEYYINNEGMENVLIVPDVSSYVFISANNGIVYRVNIKTPQSEFLLEENDLDVNGNIKQAQEIYNEVKRVLDIDNKLKEYIPRFSSESEITVFNVLGINKASDLEKILKGKS